MDYPPAVCEKARRLEQLLVQLEAGEPLDRVCADLGLAVRATDLPRLQARYEAGGRQWTGLLDGRYGHPQKAHAALRAWLHARKQEDAALTATQWVDEVAERFGVPLSAGHLNYLLRQVALTRPPGRPPRARPVSGAPPAPGLDYAGLFFPGSGEASPGDHDGH
jgi:hypothetical protein